MKGQIFKRGDTWSYRLDLGVDPATGKRLRPSKGGYVSEDAAAIAMAEARIALASGTYPDTKTILFKDFAEAWLSEYKLSVSRGSAYIRHGHIHNHLNNYFGCVGISKISKVMYQNMLNSLSKAMSPKTLKEYTRVTISSINSTANMIFKKAVFLGCIKENPVANTAIPRKQKKVVHKENNESSLPKYMEKHDLKTFLDTAEKYGLEDDYLIFSLLAYSGMRGGELCALEWPMLSLEDNTVKIRQTCYNEQNNVTKYVLNPPKTESSIRDILLDKDLCEELKAHKKKHAAYKLSCQEYHCVQDVSGTLEKRDFVFVRKGRLAGYPLYLRFIESRMQRLLNIANIDTHYTPHSLRHTHTSLLAEAGVGLTEIMERLGHQNDGITKKVYLHVTRTMKNDAAEKFSALMKSL